MKYTPNDSNITPEALAFLHSPEGQPLRDAVASHTQDSGLRTQDLKISQIEKLRKSFPTDAVHAALTLAQLQPKAQAKFPNLVPNYIYALPEALEQATDSALAAHKAARFSQALPLGGGGGHIYDLCSGIGGDALALAQIAPTTAIDLSPSRLACLRYNLESAPTKHPLEIKHADVTSLLTTDHWPLASTLFHIDPARRSGTIRSARYEDLIPPPAFLQKLIHHFPGGAIKLSSAVDFDTLPEGHLELISHNQSVVQAILWIGTLASIFQIENGGGRKSKIENPPVLRTATLFKNHQQIFTITATPSTPFIKAEGLQSLGSFLYEADPALTRSQLASPLADSLHLTTLTPDAGYLLGPEIPAHPALTPFQLLQFLPYSESKLLKALQDPSLPPSAPGPIEVKTRGKIIGLDTDHLQRLLSTKGGGQHRTVFIFQMGRKTTQITAAITHRLPQSP